MLLLSSLLLHYYYVGLMVLIGSIQQTESKRGLDNYIMTGHLLQLLLSLFNRGSIFVTNSHKRLSLADKNCFVGTQIAI